MGQLKKVFITGRSALTAAGDTADETWNAVLAGKSAIEPIENWDLSSWAHRLGGELKDFQPAKMLPDRKLIKVISRQDVIGINAATQAVEHSQIIPYRDSLANADEYNDRTAVFVGSPGNKYCQQYDFLPLVAKSKGEMRPFAEHLFEEVHPMWLLRILPNNVLAYTGITYGFKGVNHNVTNHAVGGAQAIIEAYHTIASGQADRAIVVAYDIGTEPQALFYYERLGVISERHLKPFDLNHDGTILGEGAAALVLESEESVTKRNAKVYGEMVYGASTTEGVGLFSIDDDGAHLQTLLEHTIKQAQLQPEDISMVVAHANGNRKSDNTEAQAINNTFKHHPVAVTGFKWSMGHTLCASGVLDAVLATYALESNCVPGIANLEQVSPDCAGLNVQASQQTIKNNSHALVINRGFSSMNACLVIKACE